MRRRLGLGQILAVVVFGSVAGGCATVEYRVPSSEMQRLVQLPPAARGGEIRVVPASTPVGPPLTAADVAPPSPPAEFPAPYAPPTPPQELQDAPPMAYQGGVVVDVGASPPPVIVVAPRVVARPPVFHPAVVRAPAVRAPAVHAGGGHHGGGGGGKIGGGAAVVALVVLPIIVIAIVAEAVADANARAADARNFDGWVAVAPDHVLRLHYGGQLERTVPLTTLCPSDLVGVRFGVLRDEDGPVIRQAVSR